jgi:hypothetical protein
MLADQTCPFIAAGEIVNNHNMNTAKFLEPPTPRQEICCNAVCMNFACGLLAFLGKIGTGAETFDSSCRS